jgi:ubiquitin conjugation factor E4 B
LNVKNPEKYKFKPKVMLQEFIQTFINLSVRPEFINACARDSRSFSRASFQHAISILTKNMLLNGEEVTRLETFLARVENQMAQEVEDDDAFGDIPDEFMGMGNVG